MCINNGLRVTINYNNNSKIQLCHYNNSNDKIRAYTLEIKFLSMWEKNSGL